MKNWFFVLLFSYFSHYSQVDSVYVGNSKSNDANKAKREKNRDWLKKFTYGSNVQAIFGSYTYIYLSPTIGYMPFKKFNIGVGFIYSYASLDYSGYGRFSQSIYGAHSYARYLVNESFFLQGQFDRLMQPNVFNYLNPEEKIWVDYALVGGGYRQSLGKNAALVTSIMLNLTPSRLSIYPNPVIQVGFVGGF